MSQKKKAKIQGGIDRLRSMVDQDPEAVLKKLEKLSQEQQLQIGPQLSLKDLNLQDKTLQVANLNEDQVAMEIEKIMIQIAESIMEGKGFMFDVPSRTVGNQMYVPELDRIVLKDKSTEREFATIKHARKVAIMTRILQLVYELCLKRIHVTKRDLFYTDVKLFKVQGDSDDALDDVGMNVVVWI
jgi:meiotic recombination protein SPO11